MAPTGSTGLHLDDPALPVLTAVVIPAVEAALVAGFAARDLGITVVRRCVDIVELLSAAAAGTAKAALVSADLRGLDRQSLSRLASYGLAVVALATGEADERLLHQLGADVVVDIAAAPEQVAGALRSAAAGFSAPADAADPALAVRAREWGDSSNDGRFDSFEPSSVSESGRGAGSVIAVWGPTGAPGRSTLALGLADALARRAVSTLLIDADPYGGSLAMLTGLLDESPGIAAAARAANSGTLDVRTLAGFCLELSPTLRILTGLPQASRWPELRPAGLEVLSALSRHLAEVTVVDCGFCLEDDEELSYDTLAPRRNAATLTSLASADRIVAVASADPVGLSRFSRELPRLSAILGEPIDQLVASGRLTVVLNRVRPGLLSGKPRRNADQALEHHAGVTSHTALPMDSASADAAHGPGRLLSEVAPESALYLAIAELAGPFSPGHSDAGRVAKRPLRTPFRRKSRPVGIHS